MSPELEKICEEEIKNCIKAFKEVAEKYDRPFDEPECLIIEDSVKAGFKAAIESEQIKALVFALAQVDLIEEHFSSEHDIIVMIKEQARKSLEAWGVDK